MKKINLKTIVIVVVMLVVIILAVVAVTQAKVFMSGATSDVEPNNVVATSSEDGKTATISWSSEKASVAKIEYGTTAASLVLMTVDSESTANHSLVINSLRPATTYYYRIRIVDEVFDNGGMPYIFKTKGEIEVAMPSPTGVIATPSIVALPSIGVAVTPVAENSSVKICDPKTDYNKDGLVNSLDMLSCRKDGGKIASPTIEGVLDCTKLISDYNSDGVVNALDRINCLQSQQ